MTRRNTKNRDRAAKPVSYGETGHDLFDHAVRVCAAPRVRSARVSKDTLRLDRELSSVSVFLAPSGEDRLRLWKSEGLAHRDRFLTTLEEVTQYILDWKEGKIS